MRQGGLPDAVIDGTIRGTGRPKLCYIDNVTKWSGRSVEELRRAAIKRGDGSDSRRAPQLQFDDGAATDTSFCRMIMISVSEMLIGIQSLDAFM